MQIGVVIDTKSTEAFQEYLCHTNTTKQHVKAFCYTGSDYLEAASNSSYCDNHNILDGWTPQLFTFTAENTTCNHCKPNLFIKYEKLITQSAYVP